MRGKIIYSILGHERRGLLCTEYRSSIASRTHTPLVAISLGRVIVWMVQSKSTGRPRRPPPLGTLCTHSDRRWGGVRYLPTSSMYRLSCAAMRVRRGRRRSRVVSDRLHLAPPSCFPCCCPQGFFLYSFSSFSLPCVSFLRRCCVL